MDFERITENSDETCVDDESDVAVLEARVRDLETDVYGYSNDEPSSSQRAAVDVKRSIVFLDNRQQDADSVSLEAVWDVADALGLSQSAAEEAYEELRRRGEVYEPADGEVRTT